MKAGLEHWQALVAMKDPRDGVRTQTQARTEVVRFATDNVLMLRPSEAVDGGFGTRRAQLDASFRELGLDFIVVQAMQRFPCREEFLHGGERSRRRRLLWNRALGAVVVGDKWQMQFLRCIGGTPQAQRCRAVFRWRCGTTTQKLRTAGVKGRRAGGSAACFADGLHRRECCCWVSQDDWVALQFNFYGGGPAWQSKAGTHRRLDATPAMEQRSRVDRRASRRNAGIGGQSRPRGCIRGFGCGAQPPSGRPATNEAMVQQEASARRNIAGEISARVK